ncbi:uncharacterized protein F5891DRAFT_744602 [Suillus fuscotomentosus]|uniref:Secreted protein n=1 Tax=Suillus fuscotomentosus TaxID=1912939 RepID=A0AAD4EE66_9AGAM|nr:uncharacterized protein F5891DRAFT_744602 [Suillus fuscotomentosus]KAG1904475.1 hypothetical protein F5891DRAFT_744602 [Suillus fuscotomentosus]
MTALQCRSQSLAVVFWLTTSLASTFSRRSLASVPENVVANSFADAEDSVCSQFRRGLTGIVSAQSYFGTNSAPCCGQAKGCDCSA